MDNFKTIELLLQRKCRYNLVGDWSLNELNINKYFSYINEKAGIFV